MTSGDTVEKVDYFANHELVVKWPFTIYHHPIERSLVDSIAHAARSFQRPLKVLVFGCGYFHERHLYPPDTQFILIDQDLRLQDAMRTFVARTPNNHAYTCRNHQEFAEIVEKHAGTVHLITAKEVIEHITDMELYFPLFRKLLAPGGILWLSTPNYGDWTLPLVENTFLELVARRRGFSRKDMHPNRYSRQRLRDELEMYGFSGIEVNKTPLKLALTSSALNGQPNA